MGSVRYIYLICDELYDNSEIVAIYSDKQGAEKAIEGQAFFSIKKMAVRYTDKKIKRGNR